MVDGILVAHNQNGTHKSGAVYTSPSFVGAVDGWIGANETWTYASATTITVPTDATTKYDVGDYIKITQSATVKYFIVVTVAATLLTVTGLSGVTVANSAITANAYSKARNPHGAVAGATPFNPYKFRAYRNAATDTGNNAFAVVACDTETYDTNNNHSAGVYTAPVTGFYTFKGCVNVNMQSENRTVIIALYKNGTAYSYGNEIFGSTGTNTGLVVSDDLSLAATDTVDMRVFCSATKPLNVGSSAQNYFSGRLVSRI